jgi:hypothetical protein
MLSLLLGACGGSSSDSTNNSSTIVPPVNSTPAPVVDPLVSFSVADAPADSVTSVNVTFDSLSLKLSSDDDDDSGLNIPIVDEAGNPTTMTIDLMQYQNGDERLIIANSTIAIGDYSNLIVHTSGCPQNQNGSTEFCWVIDADGRKPLKTPSNKLKLGAFSVTNDSEQSYVIEFNLRSSLVSTANGMSYNLKPHGVRIVNAALDSTLSGQIDVNLLTAGTSCETVFQNDTDHGKVVYLYQTNVSNEALMADEYDDEFAENIIPDHAVKPIASQSLNFDSEQNRYHYYFSHLAAGEYTVAFSCSALNDDPQEYDSILIANPIEQRHVVTLGENVDEVQNFTQ